MPESKEMLKKKKKTHNDGSMSKGHKGQLKELPVSKPEQFMQQNKVYWITAQGIMYP